MILNSASCKVTVVEAKKKDMEVEMQGTSKNCDSLFTALKRCTVGAGRCRELRLSHFNGYSPMISSPSDFLSALGTIQLLLLREKLQETHPPPHGLLTSWRTGETRKRSVWFGDAQYTSSTRDCVVSIPVEHVHIRLSLQHWVRIMAPTEILPMKGNHEQGVAVSTSL